jgi:hypothetical protein
MLTFFQYMEWHRGRGLPDTRKMMQLAGVSLHTPTDKQMKRAVDRAKDRLVVTMPVVPGGLAKPTS